MTDSQQALHVWAQALKFIRGRVTDSQLAGRFHPDWVKFIRGKDW